MTQQQVAQQDAPAGIARRAAAWSVHAYTALGAFAAFAGTLAVMAGQYRTAFLWMVFATFVDASDGVLARMADVKRLTPNFDGARLDDIIDYLTFVFLPMLLLYHAGDIPRGAFGLFVCAAVLLSSGYGFASLDAKTDDYFFTGFPSYWNIVAVYLHALDLGPVVNSAILLVLVVLVFVRIGYIYPSRTPILQGLTVALGGIWAVMVLFIILGLPTPSRLLVIGSLFFPVYYCVLSFVLHSRRRR